MNKAIAITLILFNILFLTNCKEEEAETGKITFYFNEMVDYEPLVTDSMKYTNEAGNEYMITEVQYFISNLTIHYQGGTVYVVSQDSGIHYIDSDLPETHTWEIPEEVPAGRIDSITFTFGLDEGTNQSGLFSDPPESNMFWPEELGGGYHYMKLNGKYLTDDSEVNPFNFHLGIGQTYDTNGLVTGYVQNYFGVSCYLAIYSSFIAMIEPGEMNYLAVNMNIESWFKTPHTWDFNYWGGMMMQNQEALGTACENGFDVFAIGPYEP